MGSDFETGADDETAVLVGVVELVENFELMLDIHEFRRPMGAALGSL